MFLVFYHNANKKRVAFNTKSIVKWHKINVREMSPQWMESSGVEENDLAIKILMFGISKKTYLISYSIDFRLFAIPTFARLSRRVWITTAVNRNINMKIFTSSHLEFFHCHSIRSILASASAALAEKVFSLSTCRDEII